MLTFSPYDLTLKFSYFKEFSAIRGSLLVGGRQGIACLLIILNLVSYKKYCLFLAGDKIGLVLTCSYDIAFLQPGDSVHRGANGHRVENEV